MYPRQSNHSYYKNNFNLNHQISDAGSVFYDTRTSQSSTPKSASRPDNLNLPEKECIARFKEFNPEYQNATTPLVIEKMEEADLRIKDESLSLIQASQSMSDVTQNIRQESHSFSERITQAVLPSAGTLPNLYHQESKTSNHISTGTDSLSHSINQSQDNLEVLVNKTRQDSLEISQRIQLRVDSMKKFFR